MRRADPAQRSERKAQIVAGAFEAWGRSAFFQTHLDDVASQLGMTRPALYRHFRGKKALLDAMEDSFLSDYRELGGSGCRAGVAAVAGAGVTAAGAGAGAAASADPGPEAALDRFVSSRVEFFGGNIAYLYFMMNHVGTHHESAVLAEMMAQTARLGSLLARAPGVHDPATAGGYVRATVTFFLMRAGLTNQDLRPRTLGPRDREALATLVSRVCVSGYAVPGRLLERPPMDEIEATCAVAPDELPQEHPILRAVAETVAEHGFGDASIDRIARRAGLTKSSLYFHFRDRGDMFARLLDRHQERLTAILASRARGVGGGTERRLYCFLVVLGSYFKAAGTIAAVLNWFRCHGYRLRVASAARPDETAIARWLAFLEDALREGSIDPRGVSLTHMAGHLSFVVINHMMMAGRTTRGVELADLRQIYDLFVHGIQGADR
jgi:AcrR family transcriptional regulator